MTQVRNLTDLTSVDDSSHGLGEAPYQAGVTLQGVTTSSRGLKISSGLGGEHDVHPGDRPSVGLLAESWGGSAARSDGSLVEEGGAVKGDHVAADRSKIQVLKNPLFSQTIERGEFQWEGSGSATNDNWEFPVYNKRLHSNISSKGVALESGVRINRHMPQRIDLSGEEEEDGWTTVTRRRPID